MLHLIDDALEALVRSRMGGAGVDVSFRAPDGDWSVGISRPTLNLYLWDLRPSEEGGAGIETVVTEDGRTVRRPALPRVELRYLATAWASEERDEHQLLGTLMAVVAHPQDIPPDLLPAPFQSLRPLPSVALATREPGDRADFWTALGGRYHAGIDLLVRATVDPGTTWKVGPPTDTVELGVSDRREAERTSRRRRVAGTVADPDAVGAVVRTPSGRGVVGIGGHFLVAGAPGEELVVETHPVRTAVVPESGPIELD